MREEIVEKVKDAILAEARISNQASIQRDAAMAYGDAAAKRYARAAIIALLDAIETPSRGMLQAAAAEEDRCAIETYGGRPDSEGIWSAMLNQLRKEVEG